MEHLGIFHPIFYNDRILFGGHFMAQLFPSEANPPTCCSWIRTCQFHCVAWSRCPENKTPRNHHDSQLRQHKNTETTWERHDIQDIQKTEKICKSLKGFLKHQNLRRYHWKSRVTKMDKVCEALEIFSVWGSVLFLCCVCFSSAGCWFII